MAVMGRAGATCQLVYGGVTHMAVMPGVGWGLFGGGSHLAVGNGDVSYVAGGEGRVPAGRLGMQRDPHGSGFVWSRA